jgi:hypothetical protein
VEVTVLEDVENNHCFSTSSTASRSTADGETVKFKRSLQRLCRRGLLIRRSVHQKRSSRLTHRTFIEAFLKSLEDGTFVGREHLWYAPDCVQVEFPNALLLQGAERRLRDIQAAARRGAEIVDNQSFVIENWIESGNQIAFEATFKARFKVDVSALPRGQEMTARFGVFIQVENGRILRHHTYDCFDPW